jgi:hypothetical protein
VIATQSGRHLEIGGDACRVLTDLLGEAAGQATLPKLEIGGDACRVLTDLLGEAAGASHPS